jgi:hypothetical protein
MQAGRSQRSSTYCDAQPSIMGRPYGPVKYGEMNSIEVWVHTVGEHAAASNAWLTVKSTAMTGDGRLTPDTYTAGC